MGLVALFCTTHRNMVDLNMVTAWLVLLAVSLKENEGPLLKQAGQDL